MAEDMRKKFPANTYAKAVVDRSTGWQDRPSRVSYRGQYYTDPGFPHLDFEKAREEMNEKSSKNFERMSYIVVGISYVNPETKKKYVKFVVYSREKPRDKFRIRRAAW